jgi:hypothetical protein
MKTKMLIAASLMSLTLSAQQPKSVAPSIQSNEPQFTNDGQLVRPDNYREWIYLSSGLGMTYGFMDSVTNTAFGDRFDNVFVTPQAYKVFNETGVWPDRTMFALEVRQSSTKGSINQGGHFQGEAVGLEIHLKDKSRFPARWAFFQFGVVAGGTTKPLAASSSCQTCHSRNGAVDDTFVQFYPTLLPVATAKGTLRPGIDK